MTATTTPEDLCSVSCVHPEAVGRAKASLPDEGYVAQTSALLKLMADPTRLSC